MDDLWLTIINYPIQCVVLLLMIECVLCSKLSLFVLAFQTYYTTNVGVTEFGFVINISVVIVVSLHLAIETLHWVS